MEIIKYYSKNGKKPPFEVDIQTDGQMVYINCNCELGVEKKICRHKINAIRGDKENRHPSTSDTVIARLKSLFGTSSVARSHLEDQWRLLREFSSQHPDNKTEIAARRKILGMAFANGFLNTSPQKSNTPFDAETWEADREVYIKGLTCLATLDYATDDGEATVRDVEIEEVFINNSKFYLLGFCRLRQIVRTFRVDRIREISFSQEAPQREQRILLNIISQCKTYQITSQLENDERLI